MTIQFATLTRRGEPIIEAWDPEFPGCIAQERTKEEAEASLRRMHEAVRLYRAMAQVERASSPDPG